MRARAKNDWYSVLHIHGSFWLRCKGNSMLSFGLLVFILVTAIVVLWICYILYFVERPAIAVTVNAPSLEEKEKEELQKEPKTQTDIPKCSFGFGYLKKHAKNLPYPDECLSCSRVLECQRECAGEIQTKQIAVAQLEKSRSEVEVELRELEKKVVSD